MSIHELRAKRAAALDPLEVQRKALVTSLNELVAKADYDQAVDDAEFDRIQKSIASIDTRSTTFATFFDAEIARETDELERAAKAAKPVEGQVYASAETSPYANDAVAAKLQFGSSKSLILGAAVKMLAAGGGGILNARQISKEVYGEAHPVTKALLASVGASGGFFVPPDYMPDYVEILRAKAQVRAAGPRTLPMPRGTMRLPAQTSAAQASYGAEDRRIPVSQPGTGALVASYKKEVGLVPISNDLMRFADPAIDAFVRDDLVKVMALREDLAFLIGDGTQDSPRGFLSFANARAVATGGTPGNWLTTGNSTLAVGGNFITSNESYTLATVATEIGGAANKLDVANVPDDKRVWFMHPRARNYLYDVQNSLGQYVYREELDAGTLRKCKVYTTTQIPANLTDATSAQTDCTLVMLVEMTEAMLFDAMTLELAVSREGSYYDANSVQQNAFQNDETLIRAIAEHDFLMRHDAAVAVIQNVRWAPAIS